MEVECTIKLGFQDKLGEANPETGENSRAARNDHRAIKEQNLRTLWHQMSIDANIWLLEVREKEHKGGN